MDTGRCGGGARRHRARCITRVFREALQQRGRAFDDVLAARDHLLAAAVFGRGRDRRVLHGRQFALLLGPRTDWWCRCGRSRGCVFRACRASLEMLADCAPAPGLDLGLHPRTKPLRTRVGPGRARQRRRPSPRTGGRFKVCSARSGVVAARSSSRCARSSTCASPTARPSMRVTMCVALSGVDSRVATTTSSTCSAVIVAGRPGRGSSTNPSQRASTNRLRHLPTVGCDTCSWAATCLLVRPCAQASTDSRPQRLRRPPPPRPPGQRLTVLVTEHQFCCRQSKSRHILNYPTAQPNSPDISPSTKLRLCNELTARHW